MSEPVSSRELGPISPSLLTRLACPLRIAFEQSLTGGTSSSSDEAVLGSVAHRAIELALKGHDLEEAWSESCEEERERTNSDPRACAAARRTLLRLKKHVPRLLEMLSSMSESERLLETWFETPDSALGGNGNDHGFIPRLDHRNSPGVELGGELVLSVSQMAATTSFSC
jgi:hypothetical protein